MVSDYLNIFQNIIFEHQQQSDNITTNRLNSKTSKPTNLSLLPAKNILDRYAKQTC